VFPALHELAEVICSERTDPTDCLAADSGSGAGYSGMREMFGKAQKMTGEVLKITGRVSNAAG